MVSRHLKILVAGLVLVLALLGLLSVLALAFGEAWLKAELVQAVQERKQRRLAIDGGLGLTVWPELGVSLGPVRLSEAGSDVEFAAADGLHAAVALEPLLSGRIVAGRISVAGLRARLARHPDGGLNIDDLLARGEAGGPLQVQIAGVALTGGGLTWHDEAAGRTVRLAGIEFEAGPIEADTGAGTYRVASLALAARLEEGQPVTLGLAAHGLTGAGGRVEAEALSLDLGAGGGGRALKLHLATPLAADLGARTLSLERLEGRLEAADPRLPMKSLALPLSGKLHADLARGTAQVRLATRFDDSAVALRLDAARLAPPSLAFRLDIDRLDLDRYLPNDGADGAGGGDRPVDLAALKGMDLRGQVTVGQLRLAGIRSTNLRLEVRLRDGRLEYSDPAGGQATRSVSR